ESKARRMLSTSTTTIRTTTAETKAMETRAPKKIGVTKATPNIRDCPHCDPVFGICVDGDCGCMEGFRKLGKICIGKLRVKTACYATSGHVKTV
ncbi:Calcium binding EGF domain protein, partial [Trichostrongylus colubriformis]